MFARVYSKPGARVPDAVSIERPHERGKPKNVIGWSDFAVGFLKGG